MQKVLPDLYKSDSEYPFWIFDRYKTSAYFLRRDQGNFVIYNSKYFGRHIEFIKDAGGIAVQYLSHKHEASKVSLKLRAQFEAKLYCPAVERDPVAKHCVVDGVFASDDTLHDDFDVIATPGHTEGSSCFLWRHRHARILFCGDNLYPNRRDEWAVFIRRSAGPLVVQSLRRLREVEADYIVPGGCYRDTAVWPMTPTRWRTIIDRCIHRVESGKTR